jgi:hypothetical protein
MVDYVKATNFFVKDSLLVGNPDKIVKGSEIDTEYNNIATAVASKANYASPNLTGLPTAPTASAGTNTSQLATTAFVKTALDVAAANIAITGGTIDNVDITGGTIVDLDAPLAVNSGGTGKNTLALNNVLLGNGTAAVKEVAPGANGNVLTSDGTEWKSVPLAFDESLSTNGYQKLPGGLIMQWGTATTTDGQGGTVVTYPIPFPTQVVCCGAIARRDNSSMAFESSTLTTIYFSGIDNVSNLPNGVSFRWFAWGY